MLAKAMQQCLYSPTWSFDNFTMQCIFVSETTAVTQTKSQVGPCRDNQDYPVTKNANRQTDRQTDTISASYSRTINVHAYVCVLNINV